MPSRSGTRSKDQYNGRFSTSDKGVTNILVKETWHSKYADTKTTFVGSDHKRRAIGRSFRARGFTARNYANILRSADGREQNSNVTTTKGTGRQIWAWTPNKKNA